MWCYFCSLLGWLCRIFTKATTLIVVEIFDTRDTLEELSISCFKISFTMPVRTVGGIKAANVSSDIFRRRQTHIRRLSWTYSDIDRALGKRINGSMKTSTRRSCDRTVLAESRARTIERIRDSIWSWCTFLWRYGKINVSPSRFFLRHLLKCYM